MKNHKHREITVTMIQTHKVGTESSSNGIKFVSK